uniref:Glycosyltransferase n=1 Tax=Desulfobacca acetoxidans TaxID=60893 RepID=A0A7C3SI79_9BACT
MSKTVIHVTASLSPRGSGVFRAVLGLASAQGAAGHRVTVVGQRDKDTDGPLHLPPLTCKLKSKRVLGPQRLGFSPSLAVELASLSAHADILHGHGLWMFPNWVAGWIARYRRRPLVVAPHGCLDPWALAAPSWQKRLAWKLFDQRNLASAACLQALCPQEITAFRRLGLMAPIALLPNGVNLGEYGRLPRRRVFEEAFPSAHGRKIILFLSRLHPKKGLLPLVQAWGRIRPKYPDWLLVLAGPDETGHRSAVEQAAQEAGASPGLLFTGPLQGTLKLAAFGAAEFLVLPSFSEGFPLVLLEALACRLPLLITPQCNFTEAVEAGAGFFIDSPTPQATEIGLELMLSLSSEELRAMGDKGRQLVERHYTWDRVAQKSGELYRWLLGEASPPPFVFLN